MGERGLAEPRAAQDQGWNAPLILIKLSHTIIWAFFAGCIVALPCAGVMRRFDWALGLTGVVLLECLVLITNRWRCPLTNLATRFTADRADNFDIYLPAWLARHNKAIFGSLFLVGELVILVCWLT